MMIQSHKTRNSRNEVNKYIQILFGLLSIRRQVMNDQNDSDWNYI